MGDPAVYPNSAVTPAALHARSDSVIARSDEAAPTALQSPGQAHTLEAPRQGEGWIFLDWKEPADGGAVASYKIECRERPAGDWMLISLAMESEATLNNQERGKDWEYRVIKRARVCRATRLLRFCEVRTRKEEVRTMKQRSVAPFLPSDFSLLPSLPAENVTEIVKASEPRGARHAKTES